MENQNIKKIEKIRNKLRQRNILPKYGGFLTEEQTKIYEQLNRGDFSLWEKIKEEEHAQKQYKHVKKERNLKKHNYYIKSQLRKLGVLPKVGTPMNVEEMEICNQIAQGNYEVYKKYKKYDDGNVVIKSFNCTICGDVDPLNFYPTHKSKCKKCNLKEKKIKYINGDLSGSLAKNKEWRKENFIRLRVMNAKHSAKRKNIEFTIDDEFIYQRLTEQEGKCAISGIVLTFNVDDWHSMSIDRIDSSLGYTPDNILLVIRFLNIAKGNKSNDALVEEIKLCYEGIMTHS
jgi:predicted DNA-binding protein YlxM (UPF0122 family)